MGGIGGGGGRGKDAGTTEPSPEFDVPVSGKGGGGGRGGGPTATEISSNSVCEDDAAALDDAEDKGILGPKGQNRKQIKSMREKIKPS